MAMTEYRRGEKTVRRYTMPVISSNMYVLAEGPHALIVDPQINEQALAALREAGTADALVLLTHEHFDHISGVNWLRENLAQVRVLCSADCAAELGDPEKNMARFFEALFIDRSPQTRAESLSIIDTGYRCTADETFDGETALTWQGHTLRLCRAPGHSPGGALIWLDGDCLFTGDGLVEGAGVILRFPGGSKRDYAAVTRPLLDAVPDDMWVLPGHGEPGEMRSLRRYLEPFRRSAARMPDGPKENGVAR